MNKKKKCPHRPERHFRARLDEVFGERVQHIPYRVTPCTRSARIHRVLLTFP